MIYLVSRFYQKSENTHVFCVLFVFMPKRFRAKKKKVQDSINRAPCAKRKTVTGNDSDLHGVGDLPT